MNIIKDPKYDTDLVNVRYLKKMLGITEEKQSFKMDLLPKTYTVPPAVPYYKGSLLAYEHKLYECIRDKKIGEFSWDDWKLVATDDNELYEFIDNTYEPEMAGKLDTSQFVAPRIVSIINNASSTILINANKIDLDAADVVNILAGSTINLSGKNIAITSDNFSVTAAGNMTCSNATITGGSLELTSIGENAKITIKDNNIATCLLEMSARAIKWKGINNGYIAITNATNYPGIVLTDSGGTNTTQINPLSVVTPYINAGNVDKGTDYCSSNGTTNISFNKTFNSVPTVVATSATSTNGVIAIKVWDITTTGFKCTIGGTGFSNDLPFNWIAIG